MSNDTIDRPDLAQPAGASGDPDRDVAVSPKALVLGLYRLLHNKRVGLLLILAMAVLTLVGVLFEQAPTDLRDDPARYAQWLDSMRPRYGGWTTPLSVIGAFGVFSSIGFKLVTTALAASVLACTTHRAPLLWRQAAHPHTSVTRGFFVHARVHTAVHHEAETGPALEAARELLRGKRFRVLDDPDGHGLYADRFRFAPFGTVVAHVAIVVILAGVVISGSTGFRDDGFTVSVGTTRDVGHGTGLSVRVDGFADRYDGNGRPTDYVSDVVLLKNGREVANQQVRVNEPLRYEGVRFNQSYFGTAAQLRITGPDGTVVHEGGVPLEYTTPDEMNSYGRLDLADRDLQVYVITAASGQNDPNIAAGQARVEVYPAGGDAPTATGTLDQGVPAEVGGLTYTFERELKFTGLMVSRDPGTIWVWVGSLLLTAGTCLTMFLRHRRLWVRVDPAPEGGSIVRIATPDRRDTVFDNHVLRMAASLGTPVPEQATTSVPPSPSSKRSV